MSERQGKLIAFCGIDGSGKTTQQRLLGEWLQSCAVNVELTRQPTDFYRQLPVVRQYLDDGHDTIGMDGLALLAAADRIYHVRNVIEPALCSGRWVLTDRYVYSTYASFVARGVDLDFLRTLNRQVPKPDLTVLMNCSAARARERVAARDGSVTKHEERSLAFMEKFRLGFLDVADETFLVLDAELSIAALHEQVRRRCGELLARQR